MGLPAKLIFVGHNKLTCTCLCTKDILPNVKFIISAMVTFSMFSQLNHK